MYLVLSGEFMTFVVTRTESLTSFLWACQELQMMNMFPYKSNHTRGFSNRFKTGFFKNNNNNEEDDN